MIRKSLLHGSFLSACFWGWMSPGLFAQSENPAASPEKLVPTQEQRQLIIRMERRNQPADEPVPRLDLEVGVVGSPNAHFGELDAGFLEQHTRLLKRREEPIGLLFLGDSITQGWTGAGKRVWEQAYSRYHPANFGIGGERTQHLLWHIENGALDGLNPRVVVILIGTNNLSHHSVEQVTRGITRVVERVHEKLPEAKVLLLGIFPRGEKPVTEGGDPDPTREKIRRINEGIALLDDGKQTRYLDLESKFLTEDGRLPRELVPDQLHPGGKGYEVWAEGMKPLLDEMMK